MRLSAWSAFFKARKRRGLGLYDRKTLELYAQAVRYGGSLAYPWLMLGYVQFLRDLGRVPPRRWMHQLLDELPRMGAVGRQGVLRLVSEFLPELVPSLAFRFKGKQALPPALARYAADAEKAHLGEVDSLQAQWRTEFIQWLQLQRKEKGICVVGNAGSLRSQHLGLAIDSHAAVIRFNQFPREDALAQSVGVCTHVWVLSPGYQGPVPEGVHWVVMAGPDVRYTLRRWTLLKPLLEGGTKVLTVPLPVWRKLVFRLQAPPSAGVLLLQWLFDMNESWSGIAIAGIGEWAGLGSYHLALADHKADGRHQWMKERALVAQWGESGLRKLESGPEESAAAIS